MSWIQEILRLVDSLRAFAACPGLKTEALVRYLQQADAVEDIGPEGLTKANDFKGSAEDLFTEWSEKTGIDHKDPEQMASVYRSIAEMNKKEVESQAQREANSKKYQERTRPTAKRRSR